MSTPLFHTRECGLEVLSHTRHMAMRMYGVRCRSFLIADLTTPNKRDLPTRKLLSYQLVVKQTAEHNARYPALQPG